MAGTAAVEQRIVSFKPANKELLLEAISLFGTITEKTQLKTIGKLLNLDQLPSFLETS